MKNVLSIQSSVAYGHVGNTAAALPMQRLGFEIWPVNTVQLSNHTGHPTSRGAAATRAALAEVVAGIDELGVLPECDALLTGYLGDRALGEVALDALARLRAANPRAVYLCDPVMGNADKGFYVGGGAPELVRDELVPRADIVTPNRFELEFLTSRTINRIDDALAAADDARAFGPGTVVCTSLDPGGGADGVSTLAVDADGAWIVHTPRVDAAAHGAGDLFAALFLAHRLMGEDTATALSRAVSATVSVLMKTHESDSRELALVAAQDAFVSPPELYPAERLR
jgi:pyridoxine kinase